MTSQFFCEIIIFPLANVPDERRTAAIVKGSMVVLCSPNSLEPESTLSALSHGLLLFKLITKE